MFACCDDAENSTQTRCHSVVLSSIRARRIVCVRVRRDFRTSSVRSYQDLLYDSCPARSCCLNGRGSASTGFHAWLA